MGLKNAGTQFQRMMEWVLADIKEADPYIDDVIVGSEGANWKEALHLNYDAVRRVLKTFQEQRIVCKPAKSRFFEDQVEYCGHILFDGKRSPAPGKLMPIQKWEIPRPVTDLRGLFGLTKYYSEYVPHYADAAAPLWKS